MAFAATAVASIALQNFIWIAVAIFLFFQIKNHLTFYWPQGLFPIATFLFLISYFAAALWGIDPANSFQGVHKTLTFLLVFFVAAMPLVLEKIQKIIRTFIYGAAFCAVCGIGKHYFLHQDRIDSFSGDKMVFGGLLMVSFIINASFLKNRSREIIPWLTFGLIGIALIFTQTRGAWVGCAVGFIILTWKQSRKALVVGCLAALVSFFFLPQSLQERIKSIGDIHVTYNAQHQVVDASQSRILIWATGWEIIQDHPWGVGQGNVGKIYPQYDRTTLASYERSEPHLHNNYLQILAQNGWSGFIIYLFWIFSYYSSVFKFKTANSQAAELNWTLMAVFSAILVWGLTEYTFSHQFMNVQFFLLGLQAWLWKQKT
jgi:O-antigen ligase